MATYKVIQDIEAEDKLVGPLSLRQFVYAGICIICLYLSYFLTTRGAAFLLVFLLPVAFTAGFFAIPWGRDQPTEVWALAKIRFMLKPRRRIWSQSGVKELVTITAPKRLMVDYTNGLTQSEVKSRLRVLANTIDSRGWAVKGTNVNLFAQPHPAQQASDRLVDPSSFPQPVSNVTVQAADDMLDEHNNARARHVNDLLAASTQAHRQRVMNEMQQAASQPAPPQPTPQNRPDNYWFLNQPGNATAIPDSQVTFNTQVVTPTPAANSQPPAFVDEQQLVKELDARKQESPMKSYYGHLRIIEPLSAQKQREAAQAKQAQAAAAVPPTPPQPTPEQQAVIQQLASRNDLNVATLAREAKRSDELQNEIVIKLH